MRYFAVFLVFLLVSAWDESEKNGCPADYSISQSKDEMRYFITNGMIGSVFAWFAFSTTFESQRARANNVHLPSDFRWMAKYCAYASASFVHVLLAAFLTNFCFFKLDHVQLSQMYAEYMKTHLSMFADNEHHGPMELTPRATYVPLTVDNS